MSFPKGASASEASLKCCLPNGIPIMVRQNNSPNKRCDNAVHNPPVSIHKILNKIYRQPLLLLCVTTSRPKGQITNPAILKHCNPKGMPIMVMHSAKPPVKYPRAEINPPKKNHIRFPIVFKVMRFGQIYRIQAFIHPFWQNVKTKNTSFTSVR
jgi:hypothetical protein